MSMSREVARDQLVVHLNVYLAGLVKTITGHKLTNIKGKFPIAYVKATGTLRQRTTFTSDYPTFSFQVIIYVHRQGWTDAEACDAVDAIEAKVAELAQDMSTPDEYIGYESRSTVTEVVIDGENYYREQINLIYSLGVE